MIVIVNISILAAVAIPAFPNQSTLYALFLFLGAVTTIIVAIGFAAGIADRNAENARLREEARQQQFLHPRRNNR